MQPVFRLFLCARNNDCYFPFCVVEYDIDGLLYRHIPKKGRQPMIFNIPELRRRASVHLHAHEAQAKRLISVYTMVWVGVYLIANLLSLTIAEAYNDLSGLMNLEKGNRLLAASLLASMVAAVVTLLLDAGYSAGILKLYTQKRAEPQDLLWGGRNFPRLLLCGLQIMLLVCAVSYAVLIPVLMFLPKELQFEGEMFSPLLLNITYCVCLVSLCWLLYNRRLVYFFLAHQESGADCAGVRSPVLLLRGYRLQFLRIDLSHWWYYVLMAVAVVLPNGSMLLPQAPPSTILIADIVFLLLTAVLKAGLFLVGKNRLWSMYAIAFTDLLEYKAGFMEDRPSQNPDS